MQRAGCQKQARKFSVSLVAANHSRCHGTRPQRGRPICCNPFLVRRCGSGDFSATCSARRQLIVPASPSLRASGAIWVAVLAMLSCAAAASLSRADVLAQGVLARGVPIAPLPPAVTESLRAQAPLFRATESPGLIRSMGMLSVFRQESSREIYRSRGNRVCDSLRPNQRPEDSDERRR